MRALLSRPFCSCDSRWVSLGYLSVWCRYTTALLNFDLFVGRVHLPLGGFSETLRFQRVPPHDTGSDHEDDVIEDVQDIAHRLSLSRFLSGMMGLRHRDTVTGGTTYGWFTVYRATVPPDGVPGLHQRDARRVSAAGPAFRDRVPRPDGGMADGWETADCAPVSRLQKLPPPDTGRPALVHPGLPQNLHTPGGARALIRHGPGQSQLVDPCPVAGVARGAAHPRRCPGPLPLGPGPAPRYFRGRRRYRGRPAGGGIHPCSSHPSRRAGLPPLAHDGTERRIVRPQDPPQQAAC